MRTNASADTSFTSRLQSFNPFGQSGYVQLPTHNEGPGAPLPAANRREEEEGFFACKFTSLVSSPRDTLAHRSSRPSRLDPGDGNPVPAPGV